MSEGSSFARNLGLSSISASSRGYGTAALKELREFANCRRIVVVNIGYEGSVSHSWWTHQKAVGRLDELR